MDHSLSSKFLEHILPRFSASSPEDFPYNSLDLWNLFSVVRTSTQHLRLKEGSLVC